MIKNKFNFLVSPISLIHIARIRVALCSVLFLQYLSFLNDPNYFLGFRSGSLDSLTLVLYVGTLVLIVCGILGLGAAWALIPLAGLHYYFDTQSLFPFWGAGKMCFVLLLGIAASEGHSSIKVNKILSNPADGHPMTHGWGVLWIQIQICTAYYVIATGRISDPDWQSGEMLKIILESRIFAKTHEFDLSQWSEVLRMFSFAGWGLEFLAAGVFFYSAHWRRRIIFSIILMHSTLLIVAPLGYWQPVAMIAWSLFFVKRGKTYELSFGKKSVIASYCAVHVFLGLPWGVFWPNREDSRTAIITSSAATILAPNLRSKMMLTAPIHNFCLRVDGLVGSEWIEGIYQTNKSQCHGKDTRYLDDYIQHSVLRTYVSQYNQFKNANSPYLPYLGSGSVRVVRGFCSQMQAKKARSIRVFASIQRHAEDKPKDPFLIFSGLCPI